MRWHSRSRSELAAGALTLLLTAACNEPRDGAAVGRVGGLPLHEAVVQYVAERDGLRPEDARARAVETLRLVAAAREARADGEPPAVRPQRAEHLRRTARARLWLRERFEATHGAADIPEDHPLLVNARGNPRLVHPELFVVCQVLVEPPDVQDEQAKASITTDPDWRESASATMELLLQRIDRYVPPDDPDTCDLIATQVELAGALDDPRLSLRYERPGGFDLDACAEEGDDGSCVRPQFAPEWTEVVRQLPAPSLSSPFFTRFGLHLVYVSERLPDRPAGDPATEEALRQAVLDPWRAESLDQALQQIGEQRAVRMVRPTEDES